MSVRVRFAPSPTGYLHIGSARTALFNWLFARHEKGEFLLRIEDTDLSRSSPKFLEEILESLRWLGLDWDNDVEYQSKRLSIYRDYAGQLVQAGVAHKEVDPQTKGEGIIFPLPEGKISFQDLIHGEIVVNTQDLGYDKVVLVKSDGTPTYNFACVVDDATLGITHVIRGDDHISNTPKQIALYQALGFSPPQFTHIPLIHGAEGGRLSKRRGATSIAEFRAQGYLAQGLVNYLALLGWSPGENREIVPTNEMIERFEITKVNKTAATFDEEKLDWVNGQYVKKLPPEELMKAIVGGKFLPDGTDPKMIDQKWLLEVVKLLQERFEVLSDFSSVGRFFFSDEIEYDTTAVEQFLKESKARYYFKEVADLLEQVAPFEHDPIETCLRSFAKERGINTKELFHPLRVAITGRSVSPPLFQTLALIGKERVLRRLRQWTQ